MAKEKSEAAKLYVKEYDIEIGGKIRKVRYDMVAFAALEDAGYEYTDIIDMTSQVTFKQLPALVWAGLVSAGDGESELTVKDLARIIDLKKFVYLQQNLPAALLNSLPVVEDEDDKRPNLNAQETKNPK